MSAPNLLDPGVREAVEAGIGGYAGSSLERAVGAAGVGPLAIKYGKASYTSVIRRAGRLHISDTLDYTWGTGVYCAPLANPLSGAIYGRVGTVARFDPDGWKIFDATDPKNQWAYISWLQSQTLYALLTLTVHARLANRLMRDDFRQAFEIDCVVFHPDEADTGAGGGFGAAYTNPSDLWMCVGDFGPSRRLLRGMSSQLYDARPCVLIEEEFTQLPESLVYAPQIAPLGSQPAGVPPAPVIAAAYNSAGSPPQWVRVSV